MPTKKSSKPAKSPKRGATKAAGGGRKKAFAAKLSPAERELLRQIEEAPESERFDILLRSDRDAVDSLIRKERIRVRKIQRHNIPGATITRKQARDAVRAVMLARDEARGGSSG